jgi:ankyrin repeat protein
LEACTILFNLGLFPLEQKTSGGNTATHLAAMNGHTRVVVDFLIQQHGELFLKIFN